MEQADRINLIEKFMHKHWQIALAGWGSSYGTTTKVLSKILFSLANKKEITIGSSASDQIPQKSVNRIDYQMLDELRAANITLDDLQKVKHNREVNGELAIQLATEILEKGFRDFRHIEHEIWRAINNPTNYLSPESVQQAKDARFIHLDFSGFLTVSRIKLIERLTEETNLTAKQIISMVINIGEQACDTLYENIEHQKVIIEEDFNRLKYHNVTAAETVQDIINISQGRGSNYSHIRDPQLLIRSRSDATLVSYLAAKIIPVLDKRYADEKHHPLPEPQPVIVRNKTAEEIAEEKSAQEMAFHTLIIHFNLTSVDARNLVNTAQINDLRSLWHIKMNVMPEVEKVLHELTELFDGNIQMVEDIVEFEQLMWLNETESFRKYRVPVQCQKYGMNPVSMISNDQSDTLLSLKKDLTPALLKPLRSNLTETYRRNHPNETILIGRDINKFKEFTYMFWWKTMPEFMFNNTNVIAVLNSTQPELFPYIPEGPNPALRIPLNPVAANNYLDNMDSIRLTNGRNLSGNILLTFDLLIIGLLLAALLYYSFRRPLNYAGSLFSAKNSKSNAKKKNDEYALIELDDEDEITETNDDINAQLSLIPNKR